jgi:trimethyllysine dioxygenase
VVAVSGVDYRNPKATRSLCESIAPIHNTFFGDFWTFGTESNNGKAEERQDTAYSSEGIGPHTDGTYFDQSPGIQVFHCMKPAAEGGETLLVDGFNAAEELRQKSPEHFRVLAQTPVEHHYLEGLSEINSQEKDGDGHCFHARSWAHPIITLCNDKDLQIRFNPYDRAPMRLYNKRSGKNVSLEETVQFYEAYQALSRVIHSANSLFTLKMAPGTVIFIDNHRVLHGRKAFKEHRRMCGCYLSRDGLLAKARPLLSSTFDNV